MHIVFVHMHAVSGCRDMAPPKSTWMTREGDIMEVGCHTGSRTWTLRCENNQWIGAVGFCGETAISPEKNSESAKAAERISTSKHIYMAILTHHKVYDKSYTLTNGKLYNGNSGFSSATNKSFAFY